MRQEKFNQMSEAEKAERDRLGKQLRMRIWLDGYTQGRVRDAYFENEEWKDAQ